MRDAAGSEIARGLTNYNSDDLSKIKGRKTEEIAVIPGSCPYEVVIHRDNLALTSDSTKAS